jgi:hypothetical protein
MHKGKEVGFFVLCGLVYLVSAAFWEAAVVKLVWWWGYQFLALPHSISRFVIAALFALVIIPHFVWFPVTLFKELRWLFHYTDQTERYVV